MSSASQDMCLVFTITVASKMKVIGTCTELGAVRFRDAYARVNGLGLLLHYLLRRGSTRSMRSPGPTPKSSLIVSGAPGR